MRSANPVLLNHALGRNPMFTSFRMALSTLNSIMRSLRRNALQFASHVDGCLVDCEGMDRGERRGTTILSGQGFVNNALRVWLLQKHS